MLKIAFPTFRQCLDFDRPAQRFYIVFLKSVKASNVGHADLLLFASNKFNDITGTHSSLTNHGKVETGAATGQEPLNDVSATKLYAQFVAGHSWFRDRDFRFADSKSVPDISSVLKQSLGREIFSEHAPGQIDSRQLCSPIVVVLGGIGID